jgi:hypothetical protein
MSDVRRRKRVKKSKRFSGHHKSLIVGLLVLATLLHSGHVALAQTPPSPSNPLVEDWILRQVAIGEAADLKKQFPDEKDRVLSATFLERLVTNSFKEVKVHRHGVQIRNAIVNDPMDLIGAEVPFEISLMDCFFLKEVDLSKTIFMKGVSFEGSTFASRAKFYAMKVGSTVSFDRAIFLGDTDAREIETSRNVTANEAEFRSPDQPASFSYMNVGGYASFISTKFSGPVAFVSADINIDFLASGAEFRNGNQWALFPSMRVGGNVSFLSTKFSGPAAFEGADIHGHLMIRGCEFRSAQGQASFVGMKVGGDVISEESIFSGPVNFDSAVITGHFKGRGTRFRSTTQPVFFSNMKVGGHLYFFGVAFSGPVAFVSTVIAGDFNGNNIEFSNSEHRITFNLMKVGGNVYIPKATFSGLVTFFSTEIRGHVEANGATFRNANFNNMRTGGNVLLPEVKFSGPVTFNSADIRGDLEANGAEFRDVNFGHMKVGGYVNFQKTRFLGELIFVGAEITGNVTVHEAKVLGEATFMGADIKGNLEAVKSEFKNPDKEVGFNNIKVGGDIIFYETTCSGDVNFVNAEITGNLTGFQSKFEKTVNFSTMKVSNRAYLMKNSFGGPVLMNDARFLHVTLQGPEGDDRKNLPPFPLDLSRTEIRGELSIKQVALKKMNASALQVAGPTSLENLTIDEELNLNHTSFSNISMLKVTWPRAKNSIQLNGMMYLFISAGTEEDSWKRLLELVKGSVYDANVYTNLETFLRRQGYGDRADEVFVEHKRIERKEFLQNVHWFWSLLLEYLVWYGRKPELALVWSLVIIFGGSFIFRYKGMELKKPNEPPPHYNPLWFSLDLFLPIVDLQMANLWGPSKDRWFARNYIHVHKILGAMLIPIGLAAVTGIIK